MNIIFEGISGVGKTSIYSKVCEELKKDNIEYEAIGDLEYETPIKKVLLDMILESPLMNSKEKFNTSLYESLLLAANHHYTQEKLRNTNKICLYDRDFLSLLAYQKILMDSEYQNSDEIYDIYRKLVLFNLKPINYIFYVDIPLELSVARTEKRDGRKFLKEDIELLKKIRSRFLIEMEEFKNRVVMLNGEDNIEENAKKVLSYIRKGK